MSLSPAKRSARYGFLAIIYALGACAAAPTEPNRGNANVGETLVKSFCDAWNKHDGHALAATMAQDVDFVNVGARWFHGRRDFETYHTGLLGGRLPGWPTGPSGAP